MPRTYTVTDGTNSETYEGFDKNFKPGSVLEHVVLIIHEGELQVFAIDDPRKSVGLRHVPVR